MKLKKIGLRMLCPVVVTAAVLLLAGVAPAAPVPGGTLDPTSIPKYVTPLAVPGIMPATSTDPTLDYYEIAVRQFGQQILPSGFPTTTVWGYGSVNHPETFHYPSPSIEARAGKPVRVKWINDLKDPVTGNFLPHLLPVDQTLHWANPPQTCFDEITGLPVIGTDCGSLNPAPYLGPVPIVTHLHGAHVGPDSDGHPSAWYLPKANNIATGFATEGKEYNDILGGSGRGEGFAVFEYPNDQRATTLWFHDHTLGMTRANVYAGPAGFYLLRGGVGDRVDNLATKKPLDGRLPRSRHEIPIVIQDRSFNSDGSLFYPASRSFFDGFTGPYIPDLAIDGGMSDVSPIWNPEFFGNTMVVNGNTWPYLKVEPRRYRLRFLNGSDSRFLILTGAVPKKRPAFAFWQIGADGGFLPRPEARAELLLGPAERADVIVDFSAYRAGDTITLRNIGPDEPFGGGVPGVDFPKADPGTTGQVMQFQVTSCCAIDFSTPVASLGLPKPAKLGMPTGIRKLSLNEEESATVCVDDTGTAVSCGVGGAVPAGPTEALLGILKDDGMPQTLEWMEPITENPMLNTTEAWEIYNFTADAHPIHIHLVQFQILNRQALQTDANGMAVAPASLVGSPRGPDPGESGRKDTIIVYPGEVARVKAIFDIPGLFVWHCHILSHEDNEMMRQYCVGDECM